MMFTLVPMIFGRKGNLGICTRVAKRHFGKVFSDRKSWYFLLDSA